ncbi:DUF5712 family protein [Xanthocytophaga agilis]|uniref:DUF5712 family protein n=1 Tax=Xanthocytophaga agilis TaxID=3048010 RepID=A0AAE3UH58_9BACT|nr:DUF5712 family protein [Xanthocytophaga agilis]MDJ1505693.1 DUF5712 family protein [Xanthocytophaga agilis]
MISKVLKAQSDGKPTSKAASKSGSVYDNKGSAARLVNYMEHEAKEQGETGAYFSQVSDQIEKQEVIAQIDGNVKGLKKEDSKFYSLIIAPSQTELSHISSDGQTLKVYTRQVMQNYAANFKLADGQIVLSTDVVWFAIIHRERDYSGSDPMVREGKARSGERKKGDQTHIHIIVSRRDKEQTVNLTPTGAKTRFSIKSWQEKNAADFQQMYGYTQQTHFPNDVYKAEKLSERVQAFVEKHELENYLSIDRIVSIGKEQDFGRIFYRNLKMLENTIEKGIQPRDPYNILDRRKLDRRYTRQGEYQTDNKAQRTVNRQVLKLRSAYLKAYGIALTELDLPTETIQKLYSVHMHKWKFYENLNELQELILKEGAIPEDFQQLLAQPATEAETEGYFQQQRGHKPSQKSQTTTSKENTVEIDNSIQSQVADQQQKATNQEKNLLLFERFLQGVRDGETTKDVDWGERPRQKGKTRQQNKKEEHEYNLED